jgi:hypothetical protein
MKFPRRGRSKPLIQREFADSKDLHSRGLETRAQRAGVAAHRLFRSRSPSNHASITPVESPMLSVWETDRILDERYNGQQGIIGDRETKTFYRLPDEDRIADLCISWLSRVPDGTL